MDDLNRRLDDANRALVTLEELAAIKTPSDIERDAAIQRFEYTFETMWTPAKRGQAPICTHITLIRDTVFVQIGGCPRFAGVRHR